MHILVGGILVHFIPTTKALAGHGGGWPLWRCCRWPQLRAATSDARRKRTASASALRRSLSSRGGFITARPAMMRCTHGRLAQRLRMGRAVDAVGVGRKCSGGRWAAYGRCSSAAAGSAGGGWRRPTGTREPGPGIAACGLFGVRLQWREAATFTLAKRVPARALRAHFV